MVNLYKEAKKRLKAKGQKEKSQLDYYDIRDLILIAMMDGKLDSTEIRELKEIIRYTYSNMTERALKLYKTFMNGALGKDEIHPSKLDLMAKVSEIFKKQRQAGEDTVLGVEGVAELLILTIKDGLLTNSRLDELLKVRNKVLKYMTPMGKEVFQKFVKSYHLRLHPPAKVDTIKKQKTHSQPMDSGYQMKYKQCGVCSGSGTVTCSSCYGIGGRSESRVEYDFQGNPQYRDEWITCYSCNGGYSNCYNCGGTGQVFA